MDTIQELLNMIVKFGRLNWGHHWIFGTLTEMDSSQVLGFLDSSCLSSQDRMLDKFSKSPNLTHTHSPKSVRMICPNCPATRERSSQFATIVQHTSQFQKCRFKTKWVSRKIGHSPIPMESKAGYLLTWLSTWWLIPILSRLVHLVFSLPTNPYTKQLY